MIDNKKTFLAAIVIVLLSISIAAALTINAFTNGLGSGSLTFTGDENQTLNFSIPRYNNVTSASFDIRGKVRDEFSYDTSFSLYSSPLVENSFVYFGGQGGVLYKMNSSNGSQVVSTETFAFGDLNSPVVNGDYMYIYSSTPNIFYQLNRTDISQTITSYTFPSFIRFWVRPEITNEYFYVGSYDQNIYQLNSSNISQQIHNFSTGGQLLSGVHLNDNYLYGGGDSKVFFQLNASNISQQISNYTTPQVIRSNPVSFGDYVYTCDLIGNVYQLNKTNVSEMIASSNIGGTSDCFLLIKNSSLYVGNNNGLKQYNASNISSIISQYNSIVVNNIPVLDGEYLYVPADNDILKLNASNISVMDSLYTVSNTIQSTPAISNNNIYFTSSNSNYYQVSLVTGSLNASSPTNTYIQINGTDIWSSNCYQETANESASCGGVANGSYNVEDYYLYINYTKPSEKTSAKWQVKHGNLETYNVSIPDSCFNYSSKLELRLYSVASIFSGDSYSYGQCYNGSWNNITSIESDTTGGSTTVPAGDEEELYDGNYGTSECWIPLSGAWGECDSGNVLTARIFEEAVHWVSTESVNFTDTLNIAIDSGSCSGGVIDGDNCTIPFLFHSDTAGILEYLNLNVNHDLTLNVQLSSPEDNLYTSSKFNTFNCNATSANELSNSTLNIWNSTDDLIYSEVVNISGLENESTYTYNFIDDGAYIWNCEVTTTSGTSQYANNNYTLTVDSSTPTIDLAPNSYNGTYYNENTTLVNVSVTASNFKNITYIFHNSTEEVSSQTFGTLVTNQTYTSLGLENYTYNVTVCNLANVCSSTPTVSVILSGPYLNITYPEEDYQHNSWTMDFNFTHSNVTECKYNLSSGALSSTDNTLADCNNTSLVFAADALYVIDLWATDYLGNVASVTRNFRIEKESGTGGGGGGGGDAGTDDPTEDDDLLDDIIDLILGDENESVGGGGSAQIVTIIVGDNESTRWSLTTESGGGKYTFIMNPGDKRDKQLVFENLGETERTISLECISDFANICKYVTLSDNNFTLEVAKEVQTSIDFILDIPEDVEPGDYQFNIIATDDIGKTVTVTNIVSLGTSGFLIKLGSKFFSSTMLFGLEIGYALIFILSWLVIGALTYVFIFSPTKLRGRPVWAMFTGLFVSLFIVAVL